MKKIPLLLLTSLLVACSSSDNILTDTFRTVDLQDTDTTKLSKQLQTNQLAITHFNNLPFQLASLDKTNRIDITDKSPIATFPEGNSFVAALKLPSYMSSFTFKIDSLVGKTVFVPSVLFLDENLQEVSRIEDVAYIDREGFIVEKHFDKSEKAPTIHYIIVFTKSHNLGAKTELFDIVRDYEKKNNGRDLPEASFPIPYAYHSPVGHINISFSKVFLTAKPIAIESKKVESVVITTKTTTILTDTESFYLQQISNAINEGDLTRAKSLTEEAVRAGSSKALAHYIEEVSK